MMIAVLAGILLQAPPADAQRLGNGVAPPSVTAARVDRPPALDGHLDDAAWAQATPLAALVQSVPDEGLPVSESTEVRIVYDADALYVGARLFDAEPGKILRRLARRDASTHSDEFRVFLDSYHDRRTAFEFVVNAAGVKKDLLIGGDGEFNDASWDPVWEAMTSVDSLGWTAEIRIPFSQLRFAKQAEQVWGVHFVRWIERKNELAMFPFIEKKANGLVSRFAPLVGIRDVATPRRVELLPYGVGRGTYLQPKETGNPFETPASYNRAAGADVKYGVSSSLTLDATLNPDFGQVEVDQTFVNLTAFEEFLEEHRPFFIEGTEIFAFGGNGGGVNTFKGTPLYLYSRRIGREPRGEPTSSGDYERVPTSTTILGAAKLSGRPAGGWSIGVLDAVTARERATVLDTATGTRFRDEVEPPANYFAARVKRDANGGNTTIGLLTTAMNRWPSSPALDILPRSAYAGGLDFFRRWGDKTYAMAGSIGASYIEGDAAAIAEAQKSSNRYYRRPDARSFRYDPARTSLAGLSADLYLNKVSGAWRWGIAGSTNSPGFEVNDLGFQQRVDQISAAAAVGRRWTNPGKVFRQANAYVQVAPSWNYDGNAIDRSVKAFGWVQFRNFWTGDWSLAYRPAVLDDRLTRGGPLAAKPASWYTSADVSTDFRKVLSVYAFASYQRDAAGGWYVNAIPQLTLRPNAALALQAGAGVDAGRAMAQIVTKQADTAAAATLGTRYVFAELFQRQVYVTLRANATFSPSLSFQLYAQPFTFSGDYQNFKELRARKTFTFNQYGRDNGSTIRDTLLVSGSGSVPSYVVDPDGPSDSAATRFTFANPDFRTRSVKVNAVLRWEYRPGSTLFVVWTHSRSAYVPYDAAFSLGRDFDRELLLDRPTNVLLVKLSYWLSF
jgi:uncharacterized protein DUF5916/cellulose/xylan binding protein with CBM9 domain